MKHSVTPFESLPTKPISVGLTCWRWESNRPQAILNLAQRLGVTVELTENIHGLRREIQAQVSGRNVDRFIGEFVRHCQDRFLPAKHANCTKTDRSEPLGWVGG
jgi:hypothetical protein